MSSYLTLAQFTQRLGSAHAVQLSSDSGAFTDDPLIQQLIDEAEGFINSAVVTRVTAIPVDAADYPQTFAALTGHTFVLAREKLAERRPPVPPDWKTAADLARAWLDKIAKGEILLPDTTAAGTVAAWGSSEKNASREDIV